MQVGIAILPRVFADKWNDFYIAFIQSAALKRFLETVHEIYV